MCSSDLAPAFLRSDNGPEFVSRALLKWITEQGISTALIDPGKPWQNGIGESFNGKFRDECLSVEWFHSRAEAKVVIEAWRQHFNEVRPHSSLVTRRRRRLLPAWRVQHLAKQRAGTLRYMGPPRPGPLRQRPSFGIRKWRPASQVKNGPKNLGRSSGPIPAVHGVVCWRIVDLCRWLWEEFRVSVSPQTLSRELRAMRYRKLSARPRHHAQAAGAIEAFKKGFPRYWPAPHASRASIPTR